MIFSFRRLFFEKSNRFVSWITIVLAALFLIIGPVTHLLTGRFLYFFDWETRSLGPQRMRMYPP
jgi:hypothetical protein